MAILIGYAAVAGQTLKIAHVIADSLRAAGPAVRLTQVDGTAAVPLDGIRHVILAAPVHERRHPPAFETWLSAARADLARLRVLMLSVSLKAAFADGRDEARDYLDELKLRTGLAPMAEALVAGAVRPHAYDYYQKEVLRHVVMADLPPPPGDEVREFTDWAALEASVMRFVAHG